MQPPIERNTEPLSDKRLTAMQARCDAATRGPWVELPFTGPYADIVAERPTSAGVGHKRIVAWSGFDGSDYAMSQRFNNRRFIAHARTDLPDLIEEIRRLREAVRLAVEAADKLEAWTHTREGMDVFIEGILPDILEAAAALREVAP